jgi:hypothetical protein
MYIVTIYSNSKVEIIRAHLYKQQFEFKTTSKNKAHYLNYPSRNNQIGFNHAYIRTAISNIADILLSG